MQGFGSPTRGSNPCPLQWKRGVLITGPPGKSHVNNFFVNCLIKSSAHFSIGLSLFFLLICSYFIHSRDDTFCWPYLLLLSSSSLGLVFSLLQYPVHRSYSPHVVEFCNIFLTVSAFCVLRIHLQTYSIFSFQNFIILCGNAKSQK